MAYAIAGTIRFDIEKGVLGYDKNGEPVRLKDIWPDDEEIDAIVEKNVKPKQFRDIYEPMFAVQVDNENKVKPLYDYRCLLYTSPSPRDKRQSRMPSSA